MQEKNYVGIDLGKFWIIVVRILSDGKIEKFQSKTDETGRKKLIEWLKPNDVVAIETGNLSFLLAKQIQKEKNIEVLVLNAGDLAIIFNSLKKTDSEDALKLARLIKRIPKEELPVVRIPDEYEEEARNLISEQEYWVTSRTRAYNRIHSILLNCGLTTVTKKEIKNDEKRKNIINQLNEKSKKIVLRIEKEIKLADENIETIEKEIIRLLSMKKEDTKIIMSVAGIGKLTALTILAYIGDGSRFSNEKQVSYYAGLVPRVDISGNIEKRGNIVYRN